MLSYKKNHTHSFIYILNKRVRCSPMFRETMFNSRSSHSKTSKIVLDVSLLNTQQVKGKWSYPRKGVAHFPTPRCYNYWKGNIWDNLDYSHQLYFYLHIYIYIYIYIYIHENSSKFCIHYSERRGINDHCSSRNILPLLSMVEKKKSSLS